MATEATTTEMQKQEEQLEVPARVEPNGQKRPQQQEAQQAAQPAGVGQVFGGALQQSCTSRSTRRWSRCDKSCKSRSTRRWSRCNKSCTSRSTRRWSRCDKSCESRSTRPWNRCGKSCKSRSIRYSNRRWRRRSAHCSDDTTPPHGCGRTAVDTCVTRELCCCAARGRWIVRYRQRPSRSSPGGSDGQGTPRRTS